MPRDAYKARTIAIAMGTYKPKRGEPKVWFESLRSMAQVLGTEKQELLRLILEKRPDSLRELEQISGRRKSNLSRTLKTLERYGVVRLEREHGTVRPVVKATAFKVEFGLEQKFSSAA